MGEGKDLFGSSGESYFFHSYLTLKKKKGEKKRAEEGKEVGRVCCGTAGGGVEGEGNGGRGEEKEGRGRVRGGGGRVYIVRRKNQLSIAPERD